jgi:hypothetical protein
MGDYFSHMSEGFDDVEPSFGFGGEPLPTGWYPVEVETLLDASLSNGGAPQARLQLKVFEGERANQRAFVTVTMGPSVLGRDGSQRTEEEIAKAAASLKGQMSGFLKSIGVTTGPAEGHDVMTKAKNFFNTGSWTGKQLMARLKHVPENVQRGWNARNELAGFRSLDDEKQGISAWRAKQDASGNSGSMEAQTI